MGTAVCSCSTNKDPGKKTGDEYIGTWIIQATGEELTIDTADGFFMITKIDELQGSYKLNTTDMSLHPILKTATSIRYQKEADVLAIRKGSWTHTKLFKRKKQNDGEETGAQTKQTTQNSPTIRNTPIDTTALVGEWKATYPYYAYTVTVKLKIDKVETGECRYVCNWKARDDEGTDRGTYRWCAVYADNMLKGYGYFSNSNTNSPNDNACISIFKNESQPNSIHVTVKYPNRENPWELVFVK